MSIVMGEILSRWDMFHNDFDESYFVPIQPGSPRGNLVEAATWWSVGGMKMILGILNLIIFVWRILAQSILHVVLPPIFRLLAHAFMLPHRRFYTPATDYTSVPPKKGLYSISSVIDLPSMMDVDMDAGASGLPGGGIYGERSVKLRGAKARDGLPTQDAYSAEEAGLGLEVDEYRAKEVVKHYDADELTKVFAYCGIGMLACGVIPVMFEVLGWGVRLR